MHLTQTPALAEPESVRARIQTKAASDVGAFTGREDYELGDISRTVAERVRVEVSCVAERE